MKLEDSLPPDSPLRCFVPSCEAPLADQDVITVRRPICPMCGMVGKQEDTQFTRYVAYLHEDGRHCLAPRDQVYLGPDESIKLLEQAQADATAVESPEMLKACYHSLASHVCPACSAWKEAKHSFCHSCYHSLRTPQKHSLYSKDHYVKNWLVTLRFLNPSGHLPRF